jgi:glucan phosphoethanolaminetransferase (alkaline phosphatase superfamily)
MNNDSFFKKSIRAFLSVNILPILIIFLVSPLLYAFADNLRDSEKLNFAAICVAFTVALCYLSRFMTLRVKRVFYIFLWLISVPANIANWSNFISTGEHLRTSAYWVIFKTNIAESREYITQFADWKQILLVVLYLVFGILLMLTKSPFFRRDTAKDCCSKNIISLLYLHLQLSFLFRFSDIAAKVFL